MRIYIVISLEYSYLYIEKIRQLEGKLNEKEVESKQQIGVLTKRYAIFGNFYILKLSNQKPRNQILEERVRELEASANTVKEVTKADLASAIPKLVLMTQVFGNIVETILRKEKKDLDSLALKNIFKEYWKITNNSDLDLLWKYVMGNPKDLNSKSAKVSSSQAIRRFNTLIEGTKMYSDADLEKAIKTIETHPTEKHKTELFTILRMFANKSGVIPETLFSVISGSKINFDKKAFLIYLMKKSKSIAKISGSVIQNFLYLPGISNKNSNSLDKSLTNQKSTGNLKLCHINFGDDEDMDKSSLGYRLRKALKILFMRKINQRIEAFSRGETLEEDDSESKATPEEICQKFFTRLAEFLHKHKMPLVRTLKKYIYDSLLYSKEVQMIYIDDFFKSLREWGFMYSIRENTDVTQSLRVKDLKGSFMLDMLEKILKELGIKPGLPPSNKAMDYEKLDLKAFRIINRILLFMKQQNVTKFSKLLESKIKVLEVIDGSGKATNIQYVSADDLNDLLKEWVVTLEKKSEDSGQVLQIKGKIVRDLELHEKLQFFLWISADKAFEKIMIKKLDLMLEAWAKSEYVLSIGAMKRPDPRRQEEDDTAEVISKKQPKDLDDEDFEDEDFDDFDISDEDERLQKKMAKQQQMWDRRRNRKKSTKRLL